MTPPAALALQGITKRFGTVAALNGASLVVRPGTVHALLGENGAGKSTLMRVAFGMARADEGTIHIQGARAVIRSPADAIAAGIGMVHQHFALVPSMTAAENVALGGHGRYSARQAADRVREIGERSGLVLDPAALVEQLPVGAQQRLEIVKALSRDARILILDEPTAVLAPLEVAQLLERLRAFADAGRSVVLITHKLREALSIADEVTVLRRGATVMTGPAAETSEALLVDAILGHAEAAEGDPEGDLAVLAGAEAEKSASGRGNTKVVVAAPSHEGRRSVQPVLSAQNLQLADARGTIRIRGATFDIHPGEIVGIAGVEGAGQRELLRALAGRVEPSGGRLMRPASIGFIPEDRHGDALILDFTVVENLALRDSGSREGPIAWGTLEGEAAEVLGTFDIRTSGPNAAVSTLSGGNQQKLVLARELGNQPAVLVAENPTRGLDVRASADVHERIRQAAADGTAVIVHSSDLDEVVSLAHRVLVVHAGLVHEVPRDPGAVGRSMLGLA